MTIYNNDILNIAKFMGITPIKKVNAHTGNEYYYYNNSKMRDFESLPFYNTWDELMPVLCKIEEKTDDWLIKICKNTVTYDNKEFRGNDKFDAIFKFIIYCLDEHFKQN